MDNHNKEEYLLHYGVMGMKWGVRRYQNADGTLTEKGKAQRRSNKSVKKVERERKKFGKKIKSKSTEEVKEAVERLRLESQYKSLSKPVKTQFEKAMTNAAITVVTGGVVATAKKVYNDPQKVYNQGKKVVDTVLKATGKR